MYASIVLAGMSKDDFLSDKQAHRRKGLDGCALGHPHGIECYYIADSMTRKICKVVTRALDLIAGPESEGDVALSDSLSDKKPTDKRP